MIGTAIESALILTGFAVVISTFKSDYDLNHAKEYRKENENALLKFLIKNSFNILLYICLLIVILFYLNKISPGYEALVKKIRLSDDETMKNIMSMHTFAVIIFIAYPIYGLLNKAIMINQLFYLDIIQNKLERK